MQHAMRAAIIGFLCVSIWSCTKIDDVPKRDDDAGPAAGGNGGSPMTAGQAGTTNGGIGGASGSAGVAAAGRSGSTVAGRGGDAGASGVSAADGGSTNAGTGGGSADATIHGRVIDLFGNPAPNVAVSVKDKTVATNDQGEFELPSAPGAYSIGVSVEVPRLNVMERTQYLFVNVTRRDPTLQVMHGMPEVGARVTRKLQGVSFPLPERERIAVDFANQYGGFSDQLSEASSTAAISWYGPANVSGYVHALHVRFLANSPLLPETYLEHGSAAIALASGQDASFSIELTSSSELATGTVSGNVTGDGPGSQHNAVFVRWSDRALVQVVDDSTPQPSYAYVVPSLPNSTITVAAMRGNFESPPFAVRYAEGITAGTGNLNFDIPEPAKLIAPPGDARSVNADTNFGPSGYMDAYSTGRLRGPKRDKGSYTLSEVRPFTTSK
jgi:hypothetical protein